MHRVFDILGKSYKLIKRKGLFKNALYSSGSFFLISLTNFITLPFFVAKLGVEKFGIYTLVMSLFGYYGIFDFGLGQGLVKFVSERISVKKHAEIVSGVISAFWVQLIIGLLISSMLFIGSTSVSKFLNVGSENISTTTILIKIASIGFLFSMVSAIFSSILMGMQEYDVTSRIDGISSVLLNVFSLAILYLSASVGLKELLLLSVFNSLIVAGIYLILIKKRIKDLKLRWHLNLGLLRHFFKFSIHIFLSKVSNVFSTYIVRFIISFFAGPSAVTYFTVPSKLVGAFGGLLSSSANTVMPYISGLNAESKHDKISQVLTKVSFIFSAVAIPISFFISIYAEEILTIWMGSVFAEKSWLVLSIISISSLIGSFSTIPNQVVIGIGNSRLIGQFSLLALIIYSVLLPLLTKLYLLIGASFGILITSLLLVAIVIKKTNSYLHIPIKEYLNKVFSIHLLPGFIFVGISFFVINLSGVSIYEKLSIGIVLTIGYYIFLIRVRKDLFRNILLSGTKIS